MKQLKKMIIERLGRVNECGGGYSGGGCGGGYSGGYSSSGGCGGYSSSGSDSSSSGRRVSTLKRLTTETYMDAANVVKHTEMLIKEARRVGKQMPPEMKAKLDALVKTAKDFTQLIDFYTAD